MGGSTVVHISRPSISMQPAEQVMGRSLLLYAVSKSEITAAIARSSSMGIVAKELFPFTGKDSKCAEIT